MYWGVSQFYHYAGCRYTECHYTEYHFVEWIGIIMLSVLDSAVMLNVIMWPKEYFHLKFKLKFITKTVHLIPLKFIGYHAHLESCFSKSFKSFKVWG